METRPPKPIPPPNRIVKDFDWPPLPLPPRPPTNRTRPLRPIPPPLRDVKEFDRLDGVLLGLLYGAAALAFLAWVLS